jgi:hypothetical protein
MMQISKRDAFTIISLGTIFGTLIYIAVCIAMDVRSLLVIEEQMYKFRYEQGSKDSPDYKEWVHYT